MLIVEDSFERMRSELLLIRVVLGLNPIHDPVHAVRVLYEEGREAFEKLRGEPCEHAHEWKPLIPSYHPKYGKYPTAPTLPPTDR